MKMGHVMALVAYPYPKFWHISVVVSEILFQYIYFKNNLCKNKVLLVVVFQRNSVLMVVP